MSWNCPKASKSLVVCSAGLIIAGALLPCLPGLSGGALGRDSRSKSAFAHGRELYMSTCHGCHRLGKNVVKPGKDIDISDKLASLEIFSDFLSKGSGAMPAFPQIVENRTDIEDLYEFTRSLKNQSWEYPEEDPPESYPDNEIPTRKPRPRKDGAR